ncbi:SMP-30/gluconolactonase/LRE family protein [Humisphaera borealis]|uniref:SMP-30/gluconolactonase/LRE family protein n=1 Tax=Humisphaera borealis TaxID=2807512 RepID=A0A7M2WSA5_9BACT|nr:SMP-30/gluconolactonase/LRE family protein [Humisphaera borealis]QOV88164.1 SMP-30/gluconolactonase/LRE family protein [Humisphaera borealis]
MQRMTVFALIGLLCTSAFAEPAGDKLADVMAKDSEWQIVAEGLSFADAPSLDADGNFYYSDLRATPPGIFKVAPGDGPTPAKPVKIIEEGRSGTKLGPDGRLYACGNEKVVAYELPGGKVTVLAEAVKPNDLAVSHRGHIYFTETGKNQISFLDGKGGAVVAADVGTSKRPNGITLSADQSRLMVSEAGGDKIWSFAIQPDGSLADKKVFATMQCPPAKPGVAGGDGMTVDTTGRVYVTSAIGVQIFSPAGELLGILPKPKEGALTSCGFGGKDLAYLHVTCGDKIYRRKTQATGVVFYKAPTAK